jgi:hypothetical protein
MPVRRFWVDVDARSPSRAAVSGRCDHRMDCRAPGAGKRRPGGERVVRATCWLALIELTIRRHAGACFSECRQAGWRGAYGRARDRRASPAWLRASARPGVFVSAVLPGDGMVGARA